MSNIAETLVGDSDAEGASPEAPDGYGESLGFITLGGSFTYLGPLLKTIALVHSLFSFSMLIAYYFLKVSGPNSMEDLR